MDLAAYNIDPAGLDTGRQSVARLDRGPSAETTSTCLRIQPYLGRFFHASDEHGANSAPYIVLRYAYWHTHFQDDRGVVGRVVQLNKHPFTIIGVAPPEFHGTSVVRLSRFLCADGEPGAGVGRSILNEARATVSFSVLGHLKPGVTPAQATADLNSIGAYLEKTYPNDDGHASFRLGAARPVRQLPGPSGAGIRHRADAAGRIDPAGCLREPGQPVCRARRGPLPRSCFAPRAGSQRSRILRQLFTEAVLISLAGGALGLWGGVALLRGLIVWQPFPDSP